MRPTRAQRPSPFAVSVALVLVALAALAGCGGRAAEQSPVSQSGNSSTDDPSDAAGAGESSGTGGLGGTGGSPPSAVSIEPTVCDAFAPLWQTRATATTFDCNFCLEYGTCGFPRDGECVAGTNCVDRHCAALTDGAELCACVQGCFSAALASCSQRWSTFMSCAASTCAAECR